MKRVQRVSFYLLFLLVLCLSLKADNRDHNEYVYLHDAEYNIADWVQALSEIDNDFTSPIHALKNYITSGEKMALMHEVMQVLNYAKCLLAQKYSVCNDDAEWRCLMIVTKNLLHAVESQDLALDPTIIEAILQNDAALTESMFRLNVTTNISMLDSQIAINGELVGNIVKKDAAGDIRTFIHNYGTRNTCTGIRSGNFNISLTTALDNTAVGTDSLRFLSTGGLNTVVGKGAARANTAGFKNVAVGYKALENNLIGGSNTAVGDSALVDLSSTDAASSNVAIGRNALRGLTQGNANLAVGTLAGYSSNPNGYTGENNVFIGNRAGNSINPGSDNIYVGDQAGSLTVGGMNNIYFAHKGILTTSPIGEAGTIRIVTPFINQRCFIAGIRDVTVAKGDFLPLLIDSKGQLGTMQSSRRFKDNINSMDDESKAIYDLNPVSFVYKNDAAEIIHYGLIAEEVDNYFPRLVVKDNDGAPYTVRYDLLPILLLNEMKKHQQDIWHNKQNIQKQEENIQQQEQDIQQGKQNIEKQQQNIQRKKQNIQKQRNILDNVLCVVNDLQKKVHY